MPVTTPEVLSATAAFNPFAYVKEHVGLQIRYYGHPLAAELNGLFSQPFTPLDTEACLTATNEALERITLEEISGVTERYIARVEQGYPFAFSPDDGLLKKNIVERQPYAAASVEESKQALFEDIQSSSLPEEAKTPLQEDIVQDSIASTKLAHEANVISQVNLISELLMPRRGQLGSFVLSKFFREPKLFHAFETRKAATTLNNGLKSLLRSMGVLSNPDALGKEVADILLPKARGQVAKVMQSQYDGLTQGALERLLSELSSLASGTDIHLGSTALGVTPPILQPEDSPNDQLTPADTPILTAYKWQRPDFNESDASTSEQEPEPLAVSRVGLGQKIGTGHASYSVKLLPKVPDGASASETLIEDLMQVGDIREWLKIHPDSKPDIQMLFSLLLQDPKLPGTEPLKTRATRSAQIIGAPSPVALISLRRLNPNHVQDKASGFKSSVTRQFRMYYFMTEFEGQKILAVVEAGNKSKYTGQFERKM